MTEITFLGLTAPNMSFKDSMSKLETIYVPAEAYSAYAAAYMGSISAKVRFKIVGATDDFQIDNGVLTAYLGDGGEVVVPDAVTAIGSYAFLNCTALTRVTIPESVTKIDSYAFKGCTGLTGIELPAALTTIGEYAFSGCSGMTGNLVIPDSVTGIGDYAFSNCSGFNGTLTLSENLTSIGSNAFSGCSGFSGELVIPGKVEKINMGTFDGMSGITSIVVGEGVTSINSGYSYYYYVPFNGMSGVTEVTFLGLTVPTMTYTSRGPFGAMSKLETIFVPADAYDNYVAAYSKYVSNSVTFATDFIDASIKNFAADRVYSKTVSLSWTPHVSDKVVGYTVSRDGEVIGTTAECSFLDRGLTAGTGYTYRVQGYTADGGTTPAAELTVTPAAPRILDIQASNGQNKVYDGHSTVYVYVTNSKNLLPLGDEKTEGKLYYSKNGSETLIGTAALSPNSGSASTGVYAIDWDIAALEDGEYTLKFVLTDVDGTAAAYTGRVIIDRSVPAQIVGVSAVGDVQKIYLSWAISSEVDTNTYRVYRRAEGDDSFRQIAQINNRSTLSCTDTDVDTDKIYYYYVVGVDGLGREGAASEIVGATLSSDTQAPTVTKLTPANAGYLTGKVNLSLSAEDNVSVTKSALYYSVDNQTTWTLIAEMNNGDFRTTFDTTAIPDGVIHIKGVAYDAAGNESSPLVYVYSIDNTGPEQVTGLAYKSTDVTITLSWNSVSDDDIWYYRVERKNSDGSYGLISNVYSTLGLNIYNLAPETEYTYRVTGYDMHGNRGVPSEEIRAKTVSDTAAPVVTKIRPTSGYYSSAIDLSITATDEYNVASIAIQTAADGTTWNTVYSKAYTDISKSRVLSYTLELDGYEEGYLFIRAIAVDTAGNESDTSEDAPFVQHMIDRTAPAAPENVTAVGNIGYIEVSWAQGTETDLGKYAVYRSETEEGEYTLFRSGIAAINYIDRNVKEGVVYYYKVAVNDTAGNLSDFSAAVSAEMVKDTESPVIVSIYPESGNKVGTGYKTVSVLATDNNGLDAIVIGYSRDGKAYSELYRAESVDVYSKTATAAIPVAEFSDGAAVYVRAYATDKSGNQSAMATAEYVIDAVAPTVDSASAVYADESVRISWVGNLEDDLIGYRIYRKTGTTGSYSLISQRQAVAGQRNYSCVDYNLSEAKTSYIYKVEAVDECGNSSAIVTNAVDIPDRSAPKPMISCEATMEVGVEYYIDASYSTDNSAIVSYLFDFGDGTTSTDIKSTHSYNETGKYEIRLTVTDDDGNQATCVKEVTVKNRAALGTAKIRILDENGVAVAGAPVYFDLGEETQVIRTTDSGGYATFTAEVGKHTVGCVIADNNWLPAKKDIIIVSNQETSVSMTLVHHVMVEGQFEITRMTFEEIVAAGIDVSKPENQYMVRVNVTLSYGTEKVETSFTYNETTGQTIAKPTIVTTPDGQKRQIVPAVLKPGKSGTGTPGDTGYEFSHEASIAYLDIPVGVSSLKEFFNVDLHIINNAAAEFSLADNVISLNVPDGLALVDSYASENSSSVTIAEIKGQTTETITWILRGDQIGEYCLSADYIHRYFHCQSHEGRPGHPGKECRRPVRH